MQVTVIKKKEGRLDRNTGTIINGKLRACAYARVSTDSEDQKNSYESQLQYYKNKINSNPLWSFVDVYADEAISGTLDYKRDDFMRMISDALEGKIDLILTKSVSRFARNTVDSLKYIRKLKEKNVAVYFEEEGINTLEMSGELLITILSAVAQQESETISSHVLLGLKMKKERGEMIAFNKCLGYKYNYETKTMEINEEEAKIVRYIFNRYCEGMGANNIAKELTKSKYKSPRGSDEWSDSTVRGIIKNEKYKGDVLQGKTFTIDPISHKRLSNMGEVDQYYTEDHHEAIISRELFDKAQKILATRRGTREKGKRRNNLSMKYPFSSKLYCGFCGTVLVRRNLYPNTNYSKRVWHCMKYVKNGKKYCPNCKVIGEEIIENCFMKAYKILSSGNKEIIERFLNRVDSVIKENNSEILIHKLEIQKDEINQKINKLLELTMDGTIDRETYKRRKTEFNKEISKLEEDQAKLQNELEDEKRIDSGIEKIRKIFRNDAVMEQFDKDVFDALVYKVIIGEKTKNGNDPYAIKFIFKSGFETYNAEEDIELIETKLKTAIAMEESTILDFVSSQSFTRFEKNDDGSLSKNIQNNVHVKVLLNTQL